ncbi:MAG: signal peptide peptidase SppA [Deltaproteobacteria bacterium]
MIRKALCAAFGLLLSQAALAQTVLLGERLPTSGLTLPPTSAATAEDAAAGVINPAGIGLMRGMQLEYFHDRNEELPSVVGDGLYFADTLFDQLAFGVSLEWIRPTVGVAWPDYRKDRYTLAWSPDPSVSLGVAYDAFSSSDPFLAALSSWDVGATYRPFSFLSLAGSIRDLDTPSLGSFVLPRQYDLAVAVRPFGVHDTLAVDYLFLGEQNAAALGEGPAYGQLGLTAHVGMGPGLSMLLGGALPISRSSGAPGPQPGAIFQVGLAVDTEHVGVVGAVAAPIAPWLPSQGDLTLGLRLSRESFESLPAPGRSYAVIDLEDALSPQTQTLATLLNPSEVDPFEQLIGGLDDAAKDQTLSGVLLRYGALPDVGLGKVEELRAAIERLRGHGKRVAVLLTGGGDHEYFLASAANEIFGIPQADYLLKGMAASEIFFGEGLQKLGVHVDVARVGAYKDAPDALTRNGPSAEQAEVDHELVAGGMRDYVYSVVQGRGVTEAAFRQTLARGISTAVQAKSERLLDDVLYPDEVGKKLGQLWGGPVILVGDYLSREPHRARWGQRPTIALVNVFGLITGGKSSSGGPFSVGKTSGAETIAQAIRTAAGDPQVAAIVVRVDSGGGDGEASELIWREIIRARREKPVVVSFGDVAASGGYYLAVAGDEILAEPDTITGSIGVFAIKPDLSGLLGKLGVHAFEQSETPHAGLLDLTRGWSPEELKIMQAYVDQFYDTFITRVAEGRKLPKAGVDEIGRGRVWTGAQALQRHLIDGLGSLQDAIDHAKARAHIPGIAQVEVEVFGSEAPLLGLGPPQADAGLLGKVLKANPDLAAVAVLPDGKPLAMPERSVTVK